MEPIEFEKYLEERYQSQIKWYDMKASSNQKIYKTLQWVVLIFATITPVLVAIEGSWERYVAIVISALVAIGTSALKTFKYQENWINYRTTCETLRKEIHYYNAGVDNYETSDNPMGLFIERVESLIARENTFWLSVQKKKSDTKK